MEPLQIRSDNKPVVEYRVGQKVSPYIVAMSTASLIFGTLYTIGNLQLEDRPRAHVVSPLNTVCANTIPSKITTLFMFIVHLYQTVDILLW